MDSKLLVRVARVVAPLGLFASGMVLTACGGGGDDGSNVSIAMTSANRVEQTVGRDHETQSFTIRAQVSGDVEDLDGETLYVSASDSGGMFQPGSEVFVDSYSLEATIDIYGKEAATEGEHAGTVTVNICYDAACNKPMKGSPLRVNYSVHVMAGLTIENPTPTYSTPFGQALPDQQIAVRLPDNVTNWAIADRPEDGAWAHTIAHPTPLAGEDEAHAFVNIALQHQQPGTYTAAYIVRAWTTLPGGQTSYEYEQEITITYTVLDNPAADYWLTSGDVVEFSRTFGDPKYRGEVRGGHALGNTGIDVWRDGFEYLSEPPEAQDHLLHNDWFDWGMQHEVACMTVGNNLPECLPPGLYVGRYRFRYLKDGATRYFYQTVRMTITP